MGGGDKFTMKVSKSDSNKKLCQRIIFSIFWTHKLWNLSYILTRSFSFQSVAARHSFNSEEVPNWQASHSRVGAFSLTLDVKSQW